MKRLAVALLALAILAVSPGVEAQQAGKVYRIGVVRSFDPANADLPEFQAFRSGLRNLGWLEGQTITIAYRSAEAKLERLPGLLAEMTRSADVIVAMGTPAALAAKSGAGSIPIVVVAADLVGHGIVSSLARPGGNITGLSQYPDVEISAKAIQLLKEAAPRTARVAILHSTSAVDAPYLEAAHAAALALSLQTHPIALRRDEDLGSALETIVRSRADALCVFDTGPNSKNMSAIIEFAAKQRLPSIYGRRDFVAAGGLISYGTDYNAMLRHAAYYVDKILKGAKPADLPVEQPTKYELIVNLKTATALGLTIPPSVLARADEVIE